jgi:Carbohydrate esterase, sialic acid-specific acetylesterase
MRIPNLIIPVSRLLRLASALVVTGASMHSAFAVDPETININYTGGANATLNNYPSGDLSASGTATQVAPIAYSGSFWNEFGGNAAISTGLKNSMGVTTTVGFTSSMQDGPWPDWTGLGGNRMLISGLIASYPTYTDVLALTGLSPTHSYSLAVACLHNSVNPTSTFKVGTVEKVLTYSSVSDWTEGKTHVLFTGLTPSATGTLSVQAKSTGELVLNGFQILDTTTVGDIVSFSFPSFGDATISGTSINMMLPFGTNVTNLSPTYTLSPGSTCSRASGSAQNFTSPVHYVVTAADSSTKHFVVTVTVNPVPEPVFTLTAPTNWDGRQTITLQGNVTNAAQITAAGGTLSPATWSTSGVVATSSVSAAGLTLTRAFGNGELSASLSYNTGGGTVTRTAVITVLQPASSTFVQRTPDLNEKPEDGQFFARDDSGSGIIYYNGSQSGSPSSVYLQIYRTESGSDIQYGAKLQQTLVAGRYSFSAPIQAGLFKYKVVYGTTSGGTDTPVATVSNLICGDAFLLQGQSNTLASIPDTPDTSSYYSNEFIRSYGNVFQGNNDGGWGTALRTRTWGIPEYGRHQIGGWGMRLAKNLREKYNMPICIINGAVGGTRIDQHQRDDANQGNSNTIYGDLLNRVRSAKLTHGVRAVLWLQGENDQVSAGPYVPEQNYKTYRQNFFNLTADWEDNYPNIKNYYIFQILPGACGGGAGQNELREIQRTLPSFYTNLRVMPTITADPGDSCHYALSGLEQLGDLMTPLVEQDFYGRSTAEIFTSPSVQRAYFTTAAKNEVALEFGQPMAANFAAQGMLFLDGVSNKVASGSVSGNTIKLQLTAASTASTITYVQGGSFDRANLILGSNGIAAMTFHNVPISTSSVVPYASWISSKGLSNANAAGNADPDNDGIQNALECVLGGEPNPATAGSNSNALLPTSSTTTGDLVFKFKRKDASEGAVTLTFEWSTDLAFTTVNSMPVGAVGATVSGLVMTVAENTPDAVTDDIVITVPASKSAGGKLFGRLRATVP